MATERKPKKVNYLNNRDILKEIHKSKVSYCWFSDIATDSQYDVIVANLADINDEVLAAGKKEQADRIKRASGDIIPVEDIADTDLVVRVMDNSHIPLGPKKLTKKAAAKIAAKKNVEEFFDFGDDDKEDIAPIDPAGEMVPVRVNFPAFLHYRLLNGEWSVVGRSHWKGDLESGEFCKTHGAMTPKLAHMFIKLCERYATRSNWRGYCVDTETEALTQRGWLSENEITEDDIILSYSNGKMVWSDIKSIYRGEFDGLMHKLDVKGMDALITPGHKLVTKRGLVKVEYLLQSDKVILIGDALESSNNVYSNDLVELVGWIITEGCFQRPKKSIEIYQNPGEYADRIRNCLNNLNFKFSEKLRDNKNICFSILRRDSHVIFDLIPDKNLTMDFIVNLTTDQRELLIKTMIDGDGWRHGKLQRYCQKDKNHVDLFQALCAISGHKTNSHYADIISYGKKTFIYTINLFSRKNTNGACIDFNGGERNGVRKGQGKATHPNEPTVYHKGIVWCPETEYGSFVARRNGKVYLTGNTYNEEMRGQALLQLSQVGLQFNEFKSQNPFAYYTATITNSFTRVLNIEKRNQTIRDDILEINGLNPSWTRQNSDMKFPGDEPASTFRKIAMRNAADKK